MVINIGFFLAQLFQEQKVTVMMKYQNWRKETQGSQA